MSAVLDALARALRDLFSVRVLWVVVWPMGVALLLWLALGVTFWSTFSGWLAQGLDAIGIQAWLADLATGMTAVTSPAFGEIFIVPGVNDTDAELRLLAEACGRIRPERVQINSLDRPGAEKWVEPLSAEGLERIKGFFQGFAVDIIGKPGTRGDMELARKKSDLTMAVTATIERRPSTIDDLCRALGASAGEVETVIAGLSSKGLLEVNELRRGTFYSIKKRD